MQRLVVKDRTTKALLVHKPQTSSVSHTTSRPFPGSILQKNPSCACGGGCPRCQQGSGHRDIQTKLAISTPGDEYEKEADLVAEQVLRMPEPHTNTGAALSARRFSPTLSRKCAACEATTYENGDGVSLGDVSPGTGQPLAESERAYFEPRFGHDFSGVRVHTDSRATDLARSVNARAYTFGREIVFGAGEYAPGSSGGRLLLAHELTHVVQQETSHNLFRPLNPLTATVRLKTGSGLDEGCGRFSNIANHSVLDAVDHPAPNCSTPTGFRRVQFQRPPNPSSGDQEGARLHGRCDGGARECSSPWHAVCRGTGYPFFESGSAAAPPDTTPL